MEHPLELFGFRDEGPETMASGLLAKTCSLEPGCLFARRPFGLLSLGALATGSPANSATLAATPSQSSLASWWSIRRNDRHADFVLVCSKVKTQAIKTYFAKCFG